MNTKTEIEMVIDPKTGEASDVPPWVMVEIEKQEYENPPPKMAVTMVRDASFAHSNGAVIFCGLRPCQGMRQNKDLQWVGQICLRGSPRKATWRGYLVNGITRGAWFVEMERDVYDLHLRLDCREDAIVILEDLFKLSTPAQAARKLGWRGRNAREAMTVVMEAARLMLPMYTRYKTRADLPEWIQKKLDSMVCFYGGSPPSLAGMSEIDKLRVEMKAMAEAQAELQARIDALEI